MFNPDIVSAQESQHLDSLLGSSVWGRIADVRVLWLYLGEARVQN